MDANTQLASDVHLLTAPLRFILRSILWFIFLFFAPAILLVVPLALVHFFPGDDTIGLLKVLLGMLGPFACAFWLVIASAYPQARQAVREGRRYKAGFRGHLKAIAFMVIGFVMSAAAMLYVVQSARHDSDTVWFIKAYLAVFSPIFLLVGWRVLRRIASGKVGGLMDSVNVYVLTTLSLDENGTVTSKNVGATFNIHDAEAHVARGVEHEYETHSINANWREDAEVTATVLAMRAFREIVASQVEEALR